MANKTDRDAFLTRFAAVLGDAPTPEQAASAYELTRDEGPALGNSANWDGACSWLTANYEAANDDDRRHWAVLEGSELLTRANE
ncbi:hypothetical protein OHA38_20325 [Streptomyces sp. NBC_01732]|uniref:hypothetical protein n=1 Tax=Streptomyces sp. NBC_01732 TaxID=2975926 RepID=UPI00352F009F|nr:hypothetical protein OHA38_20325 [Streptomyces sp. NBC_01732]